LKIILLRQRRRNYSSPMKNYLPSPAMMRKLFTGEQLLSVASDD
jgi:hypothetical protein